MKAMKMTWETTEDNTLGIMYLPFLGLRIVRVDHSAALADLAEHDARRNLPYVKVSVISGPTADGGDDVLRSEWFDTVDEADVWVGHYVDRVRRMRSAGAGVSF